MLDCLPLALRLASYSQPGNSASGILIFAALGGAGLEIATGTALAIWPLAS